MSCLSQNDLPIAPFKADRVHTEDTASQCEHQNQGDWDKDCELNQMTADSFHNSSPTQTQRFIAEHQPSAPALTRPEIVRQPVVNTSTVATQLQKAEKTLNKHMGTLTKCDKYIRLMSSFLKTYRAYNPKTHLSSLYKELVETRRVIAWEGTIQETVELATQKHSLGMTLFKLMQVVGGLADLIGFWLTRIDKQAKKHQALIDNLEQTDSNTYFAGCLTWVGIYLNRYLKAYNDKSMDAGEKKEKTTVNGLKTIKYMLDSITSYNNSSVASRVGTVNKKLAGYLTILSSCINMYLIWR